MIKFLQKTELVKKDYDVFGEAHLMNNWKHVRFLLEHA